MANTNIPIILNPNGGKWINGVGGLIIDDPDSSLTINCVVGEGHFTYGDSIGLPTANQIMKKDNQDNVITHVLLGWSRAQYNDNGQTVHEEYDYNKIIYAGDYTLYDGINQSGENLYAVWKPLNTTTGSVIFRENVNGTIGTTVTTQRIVDINSTTGASDIWVQVVEALNSVNGESTTGHVTFIIPQGTPTPVNDVKFECGFKTNDDWTLSDITNGNTNVDGTSPSTYKVNINSVIGAYPNKYMVWRRDGKDVDPTTLLGDGDTFYGVVMTRDTTPKHVVAFPVVINETFNEELKDIWGFGDDPMFTTRDANGVSSRNYGTTTVISGNRSISSSRLESPQDGVFNAVTGDIVNLTAKSKGDTAFLGWYRREHVYNATAGIEIDFEHSTAKTELTYSLVSDEPDYKAKVYANDVENQYAAVFSATAEKPSSAVFEIPFSWAVMLSEDDSTYVPAIVPFDKPELKLLKDSYMKIVVPFGYKPQVEGYFAVRSKDALDTTEQLFGDWVYKICDSDAEDASPVIVLANNPVVIEMENTLVGGYYIIDANNANIDYTTITSIFFEEGKAEFEIEYAGEGDGYIVVALRAGQVPQLNSNPDAFVEINEEKQHEGELPIIVNNDDILTILYNEGLVNAEGKVPEESPYFLYTLDGGRLMINRDPLTPGTNYTISIVAV